jgi:uncharacterized protein
MPVTVSYPGVYIEEIPSGVRTITGVATSIAAFIGRALRGPTNKAVVINGFGDFERIFGGLWRGNSLGYAVRDFFLNGGGQAIVVRLYREEAGQPSKATLAVGGLTLEAAYEGAWGKYLRASIDKDVSQEVADRMGVAKTDLFNLTIRDTGPGGGSESFRNVTVVASARQIDKVLEAESNLVQTKGNLPATVSAGDDSLSKEEAGLKTAQDELKAAQAELAAAQAEQPPDPAKISTAQGKVTAKQTAVTTAEGKVDTASGPLDASNGLDLTSAELSPQNGLTEKKGLFALEQADIFNILSIPPYLSDGNVDKNIVSEAAAYCEKRRAMLLVDPPSGWKTKDAAKGDGSTTGVAAVGTNSKNAALFFPRLLEADPLRDNRLEEVAPGGAVAGIFARTDTQRGVWKAPAGLDATLVGVPQLTVNLTDLENGELNQLGVNCLRTLPAAGRVVWGARTLQGNDRLASEWKYIPVRRLALFIEESLYRGTQWVVFEPNDEPLWAQIRLNVGAFMQNLFRQGAFQGQTPKDAYLVKCDKETTTQNDINLGIVNIVVGFAPLKPAEFVIIKIQQLAGQIQT